MRRVEIFQKIISAKGLESAQSGFSNSCTGLKSKCVSKLATQIKSNERFGPNKGAQGGFDFSKRISQYVPSFNTSKCFFYKWGI